MDEAVAVLRTSRAEQRRLVAETVERNAARYVAEVSELVALGRGGEQAIQAHVEGRLRGLGGHVEILCYDPRQLDVPYEFVHPDAVAPGAHTSIFGAWAGAGGGRSLLLFAHPDPEPLTEQVRWNRPLFEATHEDGRLFGWGVADDLAGLAAMLCAWDAVKSSEVDLVGGVYLASAPSKGYARGIVPVLDRLPVVDGALYLHPAESGRGLAQIKTATSGSVRLVIRVTGRPPNTVEPDQTPFASEAINPLELTMRFLSTLHAVADERVAGASIHVTYLSGGAREHLHRVPGWTEAGIVAAFPASVSPTRTQAAIAEIVRRWSRGDSWLARRPPALTWLSGTAGAATSDDDGIVRLIRTEVAEVTGRLPSRYERHASSDIRHPILHRGIPAVGLGPLAGGFVQAGGADEWVDIREYLQTIRAVAAAIVRWCGCGQRRK